ARQSAAETGTAPAARNGALTPLPIPVSATSDGARQSGTSLISKQSVPAARGTTNSLIEEYREVLTRSLPIKAGQRVLVVDDDADARELISQFIQDLGAKAIACPSPTAALRMAT